jgi:hypothetical protein
MMQDADDWASPRRAAALLTSMLENNSDLAVSAQPQFCERADGSPCQIGTRWDRMANDEVGEKFTFQNQLSEKFLYRAPHHGLINIATLDKIGGYYGGFRVGWDTVLTNLILMVGSVSWTPEPLYYRLVRTDSLTHSAETGFRSTYAAAVGKCLERIYRDCYTKYLQYCLGKISYSAFVDYIRTISSRYITREDRSALVSETEKLGKAML